MEIPMVVYKFDYEPEEYYVDVFTGELYTPEQVKEHGFSIVSKQEAEKVADEYLAKVRNQ